MGQSWRSSVFQLVSFVIVEQQYALPLSVVERVLPMVAVSPLPHAPSIALGVINLHGQVIRCSTSVVASDFPPATMG